MSQLSCVKDATKHFVCIMPSTVGVALVLYLPTLFPATSLLINQKSVRIHFLPLCPFTIPDGRADPVLLFHALF